MSSLKDQIIPQINNSWQPDKLTIKSKGNETYQLYHYVNYFNKAKYQDKSPYKTKRYSDSSLSLFKVQFEFIKKLETKKTDYFTPIWIFKTDDNHKIAIHNYREVNFKHWFYFDESIVVDYNTQLKRARVG